MRAFLTAGAAALILMVAACGGGASNSGASGGAPAGPLKQIAAPNNGDWTRVVTATEQGFRMGNPDAPVKLVEYASITCPHCAEFAAGAGPLTEQYVRSGQVSWEYRPHMLFSPDPGIFALLQCQGAEPYFQLVDQLYRDQQNWGLRAQQQEQATAGLPAAERAVALIRGAGLDQFFRQRGMPQSQIDACLANPQNLQRIADLTQRARTEEGISGTPTFLINGTKQENIGTWEALEPLLRSAIGG